MESRLYRGFESDLLLLSFYFIHFSFFSFFYVLLHLIFIREFSGTIDARNLKLGICMDNIKFALS